MKLIILTSIVALFWLPFSIGYDCNCACCITPPSNCVPANRPAVDVADCSACTNQLCTSKYPSQCPAVNSLIRNTCSSVITSGSSEQQQRITPVLVVLLMAISYIYCSSLLH